MPESYGIHPILNIAHLEKYQPSPSEFGNCPTENLIAEQCKKGRNGWHIIQYLTQFKGFSADYNEWLTLKQLRNTPENLETWRIFREQSMPQSQ